MMIPNTFGLLSPRQTQDIYSQYTYGRPVRVPCAIVEIKASVMKTSVRVDQSASRGNEEEQTVVATILFPKTVKIREDDKFQIANTTMRVMSIEPRFSVAGNLDHFEVSFGILL